MFHTDIESDSSGFQTPDGLYTPIILSEVTCSGTEQGLTECDYQEIGPGQCSLEATVSCAGMIVSCFERDK